MKNSVLDLNILVSEVLAHEHSQTDPFIPRRGELAACERLRKQGFLLDARGGFIITPNAVKMVYRLVDQLDLANGK